MASAAILVARIRFRLRKPRANHRKMQRALRAQYSHNRQLQVCSLSTCYNYHNKQVRIQVSNGAKQQTDIASGRKNTE